MKRFFSSSRGSALLIALVVLVLLLILTTVFLERVWDSSRTVNGLEASNAAFYQAMGVVEMQLDDPSVTKKTPWDIENFSDTYAYTGRTLTASTGGTIMPIPGKGNSPYDSDYNIISLGQPVQIVLPEGLNWNNISFHFRVPQIDASAGTGVAGVQTSSGIILWTIGYSGASLYASGETQIFRGIDINTPTSMVSFSGLTNSGSNITVNEFYTDNNYLGLNGAKCLGYTCTLKLSMLRNVETSLTSGGPSDGRSLPFLEYKIDFGTESVPSQYMVLDATAWAYGFQRSHTVRIPQITTNTALDFAVLQ